ncbi:hypothetical protein M405DRAFT_807826 [Rhizopogon salebrosus TDB-379]|nr:hypothetical protein M405DRAFT_807826 [Rhizopogon salebrosus TDB-379]
MQRPYDISIVDRRLVEDARPFGIFSVLAALLQRVHACGGPPSHPYDIIAQKQRILGHTVYLADLECEDAGENDELPVMDTEAEKWPRKMWAF